MALFTSRLSQVTEGAYSSLYAAGNAFQRVEKEFFAEPFGARGRERKEDLAFLFTVDGDACFTRERGQSAASSIFH